MQVYKVCNGTKSTVTKEIKKTLINILSPAGLGSKRKRAYVNGWAGLGWDTDQTGPLLLQKNDQRLDQTLILHVYPTEFASFGLVANDLPVVHFFSREELEQEIATVAYLHV